MSKQFYRKFEDRFRGSRATVKERLEVYRDLLKAVAVYYSGKPALDLGCGRGEWLEVLSESSFSASGIDLNEGMLKGCEGLGLDVKKDDALKCLKNLTPNSQAIISAFHLVEHISFTELQDLISDALTALLPGGILILETPNPENLSVGANTFYLDPTHNKPIPSGLLSFCCEFEGFQNVEIWRLQSPKGLSKSDDPSLSDTLLNASPDYSVVALKAGIPENGTAVVDILSQTHQASVSELLNRYDSNNSNLKKRTKALEDGTQALEDKAQSFEKRTKALEDGTQTLEDKAQSFEKRTKALEDGTQTLEDKAQSFEKRAKALEDGTQTLEDKAQNITDTVQLLSVTANKLNGELDVLKKKIYGKKYNDLRVPWHTHLYRSFRCLIEKNTRPWHTHLYRSMQSLRGNPKYSRCNLSQSKDTCDTANKANILQISDLVKISDEIKDEG